MTEMDLTPRGPVDPAASAPRTKRKWMPILVLALVLVAGGVIVTQFLTSAVDYYCNVDEIGVRDGCNSERRIRLQGTVDENSIEKVGNATVFTISFNGETIPVEYDGAPGGIFKECIPVVVHALLDGRDTPPSSADGYLATFQAAAPRATIGTVIGRFFALDRDKRWERVSQAYSAIMSGTGETAADARAAVAQAAAALTRDGRLLSVAGGGDTVAALRHAGVLGDFSYVSSAGGAFLEWLEGKTLPGVAALAG